MEVKSRVIYESDTKDIINQYIIFCKVFDEQRNLYGLTEQTMREIVRICQDRDILREYLKGKEKEGARHPVDVCLARTGVETETHPL